MTYDEGPDNDPIATLKAIVLVVLFCLAVFVLLSAFWSSRARAQDRGYLPPEKYYTHAQPRAQRPVPADNGEPDEYYAEDWLVTDARGNTICINPYVRKDVKIVQCVGNDKVR